MVNYPVMLNIVKKQTVVIGGGKVAFRKIKGLTDAGACITVISPQIIEAIQQLVTDHQIEWVERTYRVGDLNGAALIIAATNDHQVNQAIGLDAQEGQLINVVDQPDLGNFQVPAWFQRGKLTFAVSTDGASPLLAKKIRDDVAAMYQDEYDDYLGFLAICREKIKQTRFTSEVKVKLLKKLLNSTYLQPKHQNHVLEDFEGFYQASIKE